MSSVYQKILVPIDFSEYSELAVKKALDLCTQIDVVNQSEQACSITFLHVLELPSYPVLEDVAVLGLPGVWDSEVSQALLTQAHEKMSVWTHRFGLDEAQGQIAIGHACQEILAVAEKQADLIIMGKQGHNVLKTLMGSTTDAVVQKADCDVLVVHRLSEQ